MTRARTQAALFRSLRRAGDQKCCAATTCREFVTPGRIFCLDHWYGLRRTQRNVIITSFREANWPVHHEAIRRAADQIDAAFVTIAEAKAHARRMAA